ncbi:hypothetical protein DRE_04669 [Drechslerella stenobrocha 248]|uniref:Uncharacterized protein n=1 Tax=Drechslerella stenobrocha 248 TaxID=1043628 RepID=W7IAL6_9PEZI|nr:hypothetical protein DRE_04669 [Drechslerella stenobrocha 248]
MLEAKGVFPRQNVEAQMIDDDLVGMDMEDLQREIMQLRLLKGWKRVWGPKSYKGGNVLEEKERPVDEKYAMKKTDFVKRRLLCF